ncbi:MAG: stage II sporulation protein M [Hymenobacter sp.]
MEVPLVVARHQRGAGLGGGLVRAVHGCWARCRRLMMLIFCGSCSAMSYVNQTLANIRRGDPMAIYKSGGSSAMFIGIAANNLFVALRTFALGLTLGVGTLYSLFFNGLMLGAFQYFFYQQHVLLPSLLTIWIHGTLEIPSIVLAGGAGFILGGGVLFPGTYSRGASRWPAPPATPSSWRWAWCPIIVAAAFLEGFVTRHTEMPVALSLSIIGGSAAFIVWYFVIYPRRVVGGIVMDSE